MSAERPAPRLAATVLLVREGASGFEVFMVAVGAGGKRELRIPAAAGYPPLPPGLAKYGSV